MLSAHVLLDRDGVQVTDVVCRHEARRGDVHEAGHHAVVLVRRGCFARSAGGATQLLDSTSAYCITRAMSSAMTIHTRSATTARRCGWTRA
jgi:hypothetical protein